MANIDKVIVTHRGRLAAKYGNAMRRIDDGVKALVAADAARGVNTRVIGLDDATVMKRFRAKPLADPKDEPGCKAAIDRIARTLRPDYLMILGSRDVVPHQTLRNTKRDDDPSIPSDLPYACEAAYTRDPRAFVVPTRIVGRLPDLTMERTTGGQDPSYLVALLRRSEHYRSRPRSDYDSHFGLSTLSWQGSTSLSLRNIFGDSVELHTSPHEGPRWPKRVLERRVHFINCHGGAADTSFYGEDPKTKDQPHSLMAKHLEEAKAVSDGAVVAAECCYGADLFDPHEARGQRGICYIYLAQGCYGFFGSTCTAYGPEDGNGQADLLCQYFVDRVLRGASLGRAVIEAQLRFVQACGSLQPEDIKTLSQFLLLGDPSVQPVARAAHGMAESTAFRKALDTDANRRQARGARRAWILRNSDMLWGKVGIATLPGPFIGSARVKEILLKSARESGVPEPVLSSHRLRDPLGEKLLRDVGHPGALTMIHVATGLPRRARGSEGTTRPVSVVATVRGRDIVYLRRLFAR